MDAYHEAPTDPLIITHKFTMDDNLGIVSWNSQLEKILSDEGERCLCYSWLHDRSEKRYSRLHTAITLPSIVMATLAGSASIGTTSLFAKTEIANVTIGIITLSVGLLTTVSNYFSWAKRSESHRIADITYKKIYKFILIELSLPRSERMAAKDMLKIVRDETQRLEETSPQIPDPIIADFKKKFGDTTPEVTKPEITNGLDPIYVYPSDLDSPLIGGMKGKMSELMLDPMYRSPRPSVLIPGDSVVSVKIPISNPLKTSISDRTPDKSQTSSSVHLPTVSEADNNHT
jgi:hypothetical protein